MDDLRHQLVFFNFVAFQNSSKINYIFVNLYLDLMSIKAHLAVDSLSKIIWILIQDYYHLSPNYRQIAYFNDEYYFTYKECF